MILLICSFAAVISLIVWYQQLPNDKYKVSYLCLIYVSAALMWLVDFIFEYIQEPEEFFLINYQEFLNDSFLGLSVVLLGLVIWIVILLIKDPQQKLGKFLKNSDNARKDS